MPDYLNANGVVYTESEINSLASQANLSKEDYLKTKTFTEVGENIDGGTKDKLTKLMEIKKQPYGYLYH